jgi:hypothetical protein
LEADLVALGATFIELSLALCPWASWKKGPRFGEAQRAGCCAGGLAVFASLHAGERHELASLDRVPVYPGVYYIMDWVYMPFVRLYRVHFAGAFLVTRQKSGVSYYVVEFRAVDEKMGLRCD